MKNSWNKSMSHLKHPPFKKNNKPPGPSPSEMITCKSPPLEHVWLRPGPKNWVGSELFGVFFGQWNKRINMKQHKKKHKNSTRHPWNTFWGATTLEGFGMFLGVPHVTAQGFTRFSKYKETNPFKLFIWNMDQASFSFATSWVFFCSSWVSLDPAKGRVVLCTIRSWKATTHPCATWTYLHKPTFSWLKQCLVAKQKKSSGVYQETHLIHWRVEYHGWKVFLCSRSKVMKSSAICVCTVAGALCLSCSAFQVLLLSWRLESLTDIFSSTTSFWPFLRIS